MRYHSYYIGRIKVKRREIVCDRLHVLPSLTYISYCTDSAPEGGEEHELLHEGGWHNADKVTGSL